MASDSEELLNKDLKELAIYFMYIDKSIPNKIFAIDKIKNNYKQKINIIKENKGEIIELLNFIRDKKETIIPIWLEKYEYIISLLWELSFYSNDIFSLLGEDNPQKYLVLLQNTSEKRPGWWFFWSFWVLEISPSQMKFKVIDSYYTEYLNPNLYLEGPDWLNNFLNNNKISFVWANKLWFSDIDGKNIKTLYENTFTWENIRWVIFLRSDMFEKTIPWFTEKLRRWQFINASIDLIRWERLPGKKELYLNELKEYVANNIDDILNDLIINMKTIIEWWYIRLYLTNISLWFSDYLKYKNLTSQYDDKNIYIWDTNISFNKIDWFVDRIIEIKDIDNHVVLDSQWEIIDISSLKKWKYVLNIIYNLNVPQKYIDFIKNLETQFNITLRNREKYILWLVPSRDNRSVIYFPKNFTITEIWWSAYETKQFESPFSNNIMYKVLSEKNNSSKIISIWFEVR